MERHGGVIQFTTYSFKNSFEIHKSIKNKGAIMRVRNYFCECCGFISNTIIDSMW